MEVADERRRAAGVEHPLLDLGHGRGGFGQVDGDAHHLGAGLGQLDALPRRRRGIGGVGHRHRLHDDGRAAADLDVADAHADGPVEPGIAGTASSLSSGARPTSVQPSCSRMLWMWSARASARSMRVVVLGPVHLPVEEPGDGASVRCRERPWRARCDAPRVMRHSTVGSEESVGLSVDACRGRRRYNAGVRPRCTVPPRLAMTVPRHDESRDCLGRSGRDASWSAARLPAGTITSPASRADARTRARRPE